MIETNKVQKIWILWTDIWYKYEPLAILHQGSVIYVRNAFNGTDC